jgi:L-histidine N-alpha-methyltransferase
MVGREGLNRPTIADGNLMGTSSKLLRAHRSVPFELVTTDAETQLSTFAAEVHSGLRSVPKRLACRFFYDELGSQLFEQICETPEYYVTRAELEILERHADEISRRLPAGGSLVELGGGSGIKTRLLIRSLLTRRRRLRFLPIDISRSILEQSSRELMSEFPRLDTVAIAGDYEFGLDWIARESHVPKLILWLGSNIGNFEREAGASFLRAIRSTCRQHDALLIGIDLRKDRETLERAYNDSAGVTASFNLNLLRRINRELGGTFDLNQWSHRAHYDEDLGRIEMHLVSLVQQEAWIGELGRHFTFEKGETVHTENSHKYSLEEVELLANEAGFGVESQWLDAEKRFSLNLFKPIVDDGSPL